MLTALVGIIAIQAIWIKGNIDDRKQELATHVNDALNAVNDQIRDDESLFILKQRYGDVDSLMENIVHEEDPHHQRIEIKIGKDKTINTDAEDELIRIEDSAESTHIKINAPEDFESTMEAFGRKMEAWGKGMEEWGKNLEIRLENLDSTIATVIEEHHLDEDHVEHITDLVEHYTFEMLLSDHLEDRITDSDLEKKIRKGLRLEGIDSDFEYAVYNMEKDSIEPGFSSEGFIGSTKEAAYSKKLFEKDRKGTQYTLYVQLTDTGNYIWGNVWGLTLLSILFTILITTAFGYALHLIYKQKKISQIKNDFINNMTHELKTPLASISLATSSINHPKVIGDQKEVERFTKIIDSEKQRIKSHIDRVLEMAALDAGDFNLKSEQIDLMEIIQAAMNNVALSAQEAGGRIDFKHDVENAPMNGDAFHLINVVTNILDNSIKYRRNSLEIEINLEEENGMYILTVKDNGLGMNNSEQKLAFDKFYRAQTGDVHNIKGFGLGLSYVKSIIEKHKGQVTIASTPNAGTTLTIKLPH